VWVEVRIRNGYEDRLGVRAGVAVMAFQVRGRVPVPQEHPDDDGRMTLVVRLPVLARWSAARRWAAIRRLVTGSWPP
jgi:hypothetical protein